MPATVDLRFQYTEDEYVAALRIYMLRSTRLRLAFVLSLFLLVMGLLSAVAGVYSGFSFLLIAFSVAYLMVILMAFTVIPQKRFRADPKFRDEYFLQFSEDGIRLQTAQIDSTVQWSLYTKFIESGRFYLLVYGENMISVVPKRAFSDSSEEIVFRDLLRRKIAPGHNSNWLKEHATGELEKAYVPPSEPPDWR
jgi:hypothetical protein